MDQGGTTVGQPGGVVIDAGPRLRRGAIQPPSTANATRTVEAWQPTPLFHAQRRQIVLLFLVALTARAITFGNPILHVDEEFYYYAGQALLHGAVPFVDVWDRKPIGLFMLYAVPAALGLPAGIWGYQLMALGCVAATATLIAALATRARWRSGSTLAGIAYIVWLDLLGGQGGQAPVFYNLLVVAAAAMIVRGGRRSGAVAMALIGIALQIKYSVVFEGMFFGLWLAWRDWDETRCVRSSLAYAAILATLALMPTVAAAAVYAGAGHWREFAFANFQSIFARKTSDHREQIVNLVQIALIVSPLLAMAWASWRPGGHGSPDRMFLWAWLAAALVGLLMFPPWFDHYALPLLVPASICAAGAVYTRPWRGMAPLVVLGMAGLVGQVLLYTQRASRGTPAQLSALTASVGRGPGCLYVYSGTTMLYTITGRCVLSRYIVPAHLGRTREAGAVGVDQDTEIRRILARQPAVVVMRPPYRGERAEAHAIVRQAMAAYYILGDRVLLGNEMVSVYRRRLTGGHDPGA